MIKAKGQTWFTADWHLGETRMDLMGRPFSGPEEMFQVILKNYNSVVGDNDTVYILGDVCYKETPEWIVRVKEFKGYKILLRGNHDRVFTGTDLVPYFPIVYSEGLSIPLDIDDTECWLTHYPTLGIIERFNLVGHIHSAWKYQLNMLNVGVDVHHFRPVDGNRIKFHINSIKTYYDNDVWIAYNKNNKAWHGHRGRPGSYAMHFQKSTVSS